MPQFNGSLRQRELKPLCHTREDPKPLTGDRAGIGHPSSFYLRSLTKKLNTVVDLHSFFYFLR